MVSERKSELWKSEMLVSDAVGRLMEFWGFKRNMGRVWTVLYLSNESLTAKDLCEKLELSTGAVSMTLTELARWGVVKKVWVKGDRRDHFAAEGNLWKMISRVLNERERAEIIESIDVMQEALTYLDAKRKSDDPEVRARAEVQRERVEQLLALARIGKQLLERLVQQGRVDATPLLKVLLGEPKGE
jgi:HTH-type transcriptional regulator, glycine betaine synthesis regulator